MVALDLETIQQTIADWHPRRADGFDQLAPFGRRQNQGVVVVIHRPNHQLLLFGLLQLRRPQGVYPLLVSESIGKGLHELLYYTT
jgi:hypothetical protein